MLVRDYFDATLNDWEAVYRRDTVYATIYQRRLRAALALVDAEGRRRAALDVGCGPGRGTVELARRGFSVEAIDTSPGMIDRTLARARQRGVDGRVRGRVADLRALPFGDARFALVFVVGVTEWLASLDRPLAEIARVLAPGGRLVITADNSWALPSLVDPLRHPLVVPCKRALGTIAHRLWPARRPLRTHARSAHALTRALRRAGLTPLHRSTLGYGPFTLLNQPLVPDGVGHAIDRRLTALARRLEPLGAAGLVHLLVAERP